MHLIEMLRGCRWRRAPEKNVLAPPPPPTPQAPQKTRRNVVPEKELTVDETWKLRMGMLYTKPHFVEFSIMRSWAEEPETLTAKQRQQLTDFTAKWGLEG